MRGRKAAKRRSDCPINVALEIFGDPWSLLLVRDLMFKSRHSYRELLDGGEGIATNILGDRLRRLESHGIISKRPDPSDGRKIVYRLTLKGIDLISTLVELILWSARHEETAAPPATIRAMRRNRKGFIADVRRRLVPSEGPSP